jgi:hypothetical protein
VTLRFFNLIFLHQVTSRSSTTEGLEFQLEQFQDFPAPRENTS